MEGSTELKVIKAKAVSATPENFKAFGQVTSPSPDGTLFSSDDAQLSLHAGIPRFYIMELKGRSLNFSTITHHANVTQCLGSIGGHTWYIGVARPSIVEGNEPGIDKAEDSQTHLEMKIVSPTHELDVPYSHGKNIIQSKIGHYYVPPAPEVVHVFRVEGPQFVKLNVGTWHAGPLFTDPSMNFYNLELSDTNEVDHTTHNFRTSNGVRFVIED
ncbi:hypothetical protein SUGI_1055280 [Cryptomeria japonica]|nr:hypothetical protein SUGI_1055280 [Cryptomeria japonica]